MLLKDVKIHTHTYKNTCIKHLDGLPEVKKPLGRPSLIGKDNIKMDLIKRNCEGVDWIHLTQEKDQC
jgi:hypothetical protein